MSCSCRWTSLMFVLQSPSFTYLCNYCWFTSTVVQTICIEVIIKCLTCPYIGPLAWVGWKDVCAFSTLHGVAKGWDGIRNQSSSGKAMYLFHLQWKHYTYSVFGTASQMELKASHGLMGYRAIWDTLRKVYGLHVRRWDSYHLVYRRNIIQIVDI